MEVKTIVNQPSLRLVVINVFSNSCTSLIGDGHRLPFADNSFDGVIIQAVLEYVSDLSQCVEEIQRVLKDNGLVYAETLCTQQVYEGSSTLAPLTPLEHTFLFGEFEELENEASCRSGIALAWFYYFFLLSFITLKFWRKMIELLGSVFSFLLKYFDYLLINCTDTLNTVSASYFIGKKSHKTLSDIKLLELYQ